MYVLGIPTEKLRWFTQIGNGRPGPLSGFHADADAIARDVLTSVPTPAGDAVRPLATNGDRRFRVGPDQVCPQGVDHGHQ
jgi:hypothetical protein